MRLQVVDESINFSCGSCTFCCDQPWRTLIEPDKADALDRHDFAAYPQLAGRDFYRRNGGERLFELAKGDGTRCLFLDGDGLCIIHKELGAEAKPSMCRQFPFLSARTWTDDRVSANFGCPSIQQGRGRPLAEQSDDIRGVVPVSSRPVKADAPSMIDRQRRLSRSETNDFFKWALEIFGERGEGDVWGRFAAVVGRLATIVEQKRAGLHDDVPHDSSPTEHGGGSGELDADEVPVVRAFPTASAAPLPVRMLFAATLFPDTIPADATAGMGLIRRLAQIPKVLSLSQLSGAYASRLLGRNLSMQDVVRHTVDEDMAPDATDLLLRYFRSRFWQRMIAGTRLPIIAGFHQHIHDLNAILFLARAEACAAGERRLSEPLIRQALTRVEFHLANQPRLYDQTLKGWFRTQLSNPAIAMQSLRLMCPRQPETAGASVL